MIDIDALKRIKKFKILVENAVIAGEGNSSKRYKEADDKVRSMMIEFEDEACTHDWKQLGHTVLFHCPLCGSRRVILEKK